MILRVTLSVALWGVTLASICAPRLCAHQVDIPQRCTTNSSTNDEAPEASLDSDEPRTIIADVVFEGANQLPVDALIELADLIKQKQMETEGGIHWLNINVEHFALVAWQDRGFFKVEVTPELKVISANPKEKKVLVTIHVKEGLQYRLAEIVFRKSEDDYEEPEGFTSDSDTASRPLIRRKISMENTQKEGSQELSEFPVGKLRQSIPLKDGAVFNTEKIREGLENLRVLYSKRGYIYFTPTLLTEVDSAHQEIFLVVELNKELQFKLRKITVLGLAPQLESILRSKLRPGDIFDPENISEFYEQFGPMLPVGASSSDDSVIRNTKYGTVDVVFDFRPCPAETNHP